MTQLQLLPTSAVAKELGISVSYVSKLVKSGRLEPSNQAPGLRGAMFFDPAEVEHFRAMRELQTAGKATR
ncbi:helix-turn-helix domain-containing protein [Rothia nasimurium]|uniref:helix-turn-helix domain-containing protein n=1 Tax=Rothia nasimurium TaxID=85336 RepID=UPI001F47B7A5|nr:helix-turn-helix domain-containing protein [Rothia nasimurium]